VTKNNNHDTVTALSEEDATGEIANIFADIRTTMQIPMLTSIWRTLAESEADLASTWGAVRPMYATGQPEAALARLRSDAVFPEFEPVSLNELANADVSSEDLPAIKGIVGAYTRSNSLNLLTQTGLVVDRSETYSDYPAVETASVSDDTPRLLPRDEISDSVWQSILDVNSYGVNGPESGLATLYRHLAYWPGLLSLMQSRMATAQEQGAISKGATSVSKIALEEGARLAHHRDEVQLDGMSDDAMNRVAHYVDGPFTVARMVNAGTALVRWLDAVD